MDSEKSLLVRLEHILRQSPLFEQIFPLARQVNLPNWYIAGGCITQTIWNVKMGYDPWYGLKDIDLVYFKAGQSEADEILDREKIKKLFQGLLIPVDVTNEARVHEWYPEKFGFEIPVYSSTEDGISTFLPAFSIGIRPDHSGLKIFAPFGLSDAFEMIVRPNKRQITEDIYARMVHRLRTHWPSIQVVAWNE